MCLDTLWAHELEADSFGAEVGDGLSGVLGTRDIVAEVVFHIVKTEGFVHSIINKNYKQL